MKTINFILEDKVFPAELGDNVITKQLLKMLPLELEFTASGSIEYLGKLKEEIDTEGIEGVTKGRRNQLALYTYENALSIIINDCDISPEEIIYLGGFEDDIAAELVRGPARVPILLEEGEDVE